MTLKQNNDALYRGLKERDSRRSGHTRPRARLLTLHETITRLTCPDTVVSAVRKHISPKAPSAKRTPVMWTTTLEMKEGHDTSHIVVQA